MALHHHSVAFHFKERPSLAEMFFHEQTKRPIGRLVFVAAKFPLLQLLNEALHFRALLVEFEAEFFRLQSEATPAGHVGHQHARAIADQRRIDVLVTARNFLGGVGVQPALVRKGRLSDERGLRVRAQIRQFIEEQRQIAQLGEVRRAPRRAVHLQK